ncbi:MAG: pyridoxamine 5'-phosphate oxidase family protein [Acidimicrobiales bacterium]
MASWNDLNHDAPQLAGLVRGRFEEHGLAYMATLRRDGSPRLSGVEPWFGDGEVWLGMMWQSRKALDLRRDPRCALHSANTDTQVLSGDARISGRVIEHHDEVDLERGRDLYEAATGDRPPDGPMHLFSLDVEEVVFLRPADDHLVIRSWRPGRGERRMERR